MRDKPRPGRPAETVNPTLVANVEVFVNKDRRVTLQNIADQFSTGKASVHLGPVVQSVVSITSSFRVISLTVLVDSIHSILIFLLKKCE